MATARKFVKLPFAPERKPKRVLAPVWEGTEYPRHPPGVYDVQCNEIQGPEWLKNHRRWSIRLECNFLMEEGNVSGFLNMGDDPKQCSARRHSNYFKLWCKVNGGLPRKGQAMDWNDFVGKFFRVRIEDATKNSKGEPLPESERYSKIVEFLECIGP
jgi:hypothetical protein